VRLGDFNDVQQKSHHDTFMLEVDHPGN
jgi:hypothetical protein